jgi:phenylacetate-CoA ligase
MACGLAPVATAIPGNLAVVEHEKTALVVPPRDSPALVHALERLVLDPVLRDRVRANAYERAQEYGWRAIAESIIEIYRAAGDHGRTAST